MDATIPCICPPTADGELRHEQDTLTFKDRFTFHEAIALQKDMAMAGSDDDATTGDSLAALTEGYLFRGIESWTVVDEKGKPIEVSRKAITHRLLSLNPSIAMDVSAQVEEFYNPQVLLPLVQRVSRPSRNGLTGDSTSAQTASPGRPRKPSKQSSTSTTRTDDTGTITRLPAGDSRSSPSETSARLAG